MLKGLNGYMAARLLGCRGYNVGHKSALVEIHILQNGNCGDITPFLGMSLVSDAFSVPPLGDIMYYNSNQDNKTSLLKVSKQTHFHHLLILLPGFPLM